MKPGWRTSELSLGFLCGTAVVELAHLPVPTVADAIVRAAACLALAWVAHSYAKARAEAKRGA